MVNSFLGSTPGFAEKAGLFGLISAAVVAMAGDALFRSSLCSCCHGDAPAVFRRSDVMTETNPYAHPAAAPRGLRPTGCFVLQATGARRHFLYWHDEHYRRIPSCLGSLIGGCEARIVYMATRISKTMASSGTR